jgi:hypothetical protein
MLASQAYSHLGLKLPKAPPQMEFLNEEEVEDE